MQQQTGSKENATLNIQSHVNETDKENYSNKTLKDLHPDLNEPNATTKAIHEKLVENIPLENGFTVRRRDNKWFTTLGDTIITKPTEKYTEQLTQIDEINYELIIKIIIHVINTTKKLDKLTNKPYETESL